MYIAESSDATFNMSYRSGKAPLGKRVIGALTRRFKRLIVSGP